MSMVIKKSKGELVFNIINNIIMIFICILMAYPFINITAVSLSGRSPVLKGIVTIYPKEFTLDAYKSVLGNNAIYNAYKNTLFIVIVGTFVNVLLTALTAYPLSKNRLLGKNTLTFFIALTMWFSGGMIPTYLVVKSVGLLDSLWALIIPGAVGAYNVIITRNFFQSIPASLEESAMIDGCNDIYILFRIVLPLSKPIIATVTLWCAVSHWNSFFAPLLYLNKRSLYPLQVILRDIVLSNLGQEYGLDVAQDLSDINVVSESVQYATIMVATIPILVVYPFIQKYFVKGVMMGSVKG